MRRERRVFGIIIASAMKKIAVILNSSGKNIDIVRTFPIRDAALLFELLAKVRA